MGLLRMVVIDLQPTDDANVIFETLNARGTPLLASDLIKNSILHEAAEAGLDPDIIYRQHWRGFDDPWWRAEVRQGRVVRPRIDAFLNYWLTMRTGEEVLTSEVFSAFRRYTTNAGQPITAVTADIQAIGESFRRLENESGWSVEATFLYRWHVMDAGVSTPLTLWLFSNRPEIGMPGLERALKAIESYLVRRMVCRMTTKDYNRLFLDLLAVLRKGPMASTPDQVTNFLTSQTAESRLWPQDGQVLEAFETMPLYQLLTRGRLRMVLEGIEDALRSPKTEEQHVARSLLTIEHVMPQGWRGHWPVELDSPEAQDRLAQTIGNLTLVTKWLNPALSNSPWPVKRDELEKHTVLFLNKRLLTAANNGWHVESIRARSRELGRTACEVWPGPHSR